MVVLNYIFKRRRKSFQNPPPQPVVRLHCNGGSSLPILMNMYWNSNQGGFLSLSLSYFSYYHYVCGQSLILLILNIFIMENTNKLS